MARRWSCGFELGSMTIEMGTTSNVTISTGAQRRTGSYMAAVSLVSGSKRYSYYWITGTGYNNKYCRVYVYLRNNAPSIETTFIGVALTPTTPECRITVDSSRVLRLYDGAGVIGSPSTPLALNTWHCIEIHTNTGSPYSSGSYIVEAKLNGSIFASTTTGVFSTWDLHYLTIGSNLMAETATGDGFYFDDLGINDDSGSEQNDWCGEGSIIHLRPNAAGDSSDWARGGANSGSNWGQVDEVTPNDATDYVKSTHTLNEKDEHNVGDTSISGKVIRFVAVGLRATADVTGGTQDKITLRIKASAGGTVQEGTEAYNNNGMSWRTNFGSTVGYYRLTSYFQPSTSDRWTVAALNSAQIGYRTSTVGTNLEYITALWALVEYRPILASTLTDVVMVVPTLTKTLTAGKILLESVIVAVNTLKRSIARTYSDIVIVIGNRWIKKFITLTDIALIMPTYTDILQVGRLFTERIVVTGTLIRRIFGSIWSKVGRTLSSFVGIDKPHC